MRKSLALAACVAAATTFSCDYSSSAGGGNTPTGLAAPPSWVPATASLTPPEERTSDDDPVTIKGSLGSGFVPASNRLGLPRSIASAVSHIACIPIVAGQLQLGNLVSTSVSPTNGSFSVDVMPQQDTSVLIMLVDQTATDLAGKAAGFLSMRSSETGSDLIMLPTYASKRYLDFSSVVNVGGDAFCPYSLESESTSFTLNFAQLLETSLRNILMKAAKNRYVNENTTTGKFYWVKYQNQFGGIDMALCKNRYPTVAESFPQQTGMIGITVLNPGYSFSDLTSGRVVLKIYPPKTFHLWDGRVISPDNPLTSVGIGNSSGAFFVYDQPDWGPNAMRLSLALQEEGLQADGIWRVTENSTGAEVEVGYYEIQFVDPYTSDQKFLYYIPAVKLTTQADGLVTAADINVYAYNPSTLQYAVVTDFDLVKRLCSPLSWGFHQWPDGSTISAMDEQLPSDWASLNVSSFKNRWYLVKNPPAGGYRISYMDYAYEIADTAFDFSAFLQVQ